MKLLIKKNVLLTLRPSEAIDNTNKEKQSDIIWPEPLIVNPLMKKSPTSVPHQKFICICIIYVYFSTYAVVVFMFDNYLHSRF